jgi:hypothetical protein
LLAELETAHAAHGDVIPSFLRGLRYHGDDEPFRTPLLAWLDDLAGRRLGGVDPGLIAGTRMLVRGHEADVDARLREWVGLLDHPSDYVRCCAAKLLGDYSHDETVPTEEALMKIISAEELVRPGVAGPFWSTRHHSMDDDRQTPALWMLDLLERRQGLAPVDMPFNDIDFYLHELCCCSPEHMWRMLRGGYDELALETATEISERVDGVQPVLEALAANANPAIARRAARHLAAHYS